MRSALLGLVLLVLGSVAILTGVLPGPEAVGIAQRVWPILLFVVAITVVAELAAEAGLFAVVASRLVRWGRGSTWLLWLLVVALATLSTVFLSLDTTAVLLTPVVITLARHAGLSPIPFALTTVWLACTASLLLPVSNLTNLLAEHAIDEASASAGGDALGPSGFAALMLVPAIIAVVVPCVVLAIVYRRQLSEPYIVELEPAEHDRVLLVTSGVVVVVLLPLLVSGLPVWMPASAAALVLAGCFLVRRRHALRVALIPWQLVLLASGLFLVVEAAHSLGLGTLLASVAGAGDSLPALLQLAGVGLLSANLVDNLPAYLALEPVAGDPVRFAALLIGVNAGALITPWASLATLLWHSRLVAADVRFGWGRFMLLGLLVAPLTVAASTVGLWLAQ
ncbi:MAG TPA: SLC13 family permease [Plantibacter sp.]|uniref:SLC13 family permease n=1 Tax=unclassified Plantibacter TaxID=2624265 RepID=UPI002B5B3311|nr:SLC13 family permease [Plantibacter sp.]